MSNDEMCKVQRGAKREVGYFCPTCQGSELQLGTLADATGAVAADCMLCAWHGDTTQLIGALSPENSQFWTGERIGNVMLMAMAKHGAGPLIQAMELVGILPRIPGVSTDPRLQEEIVSAAECRNAVMQAVMGAAITAAFETAAQVVPQHYARFTDPTGGEAERTFSFAAPEPEVKRGN